MRTTLIIDDAMFEKASELTGIKEKNVACTDGVRSTHY